MWASSSARDSVSAAPSSFSIPASRGQPKIFFKKKEQALDKIRSIIASCGQDFEEKNKRTKLGQPKILKTAKRTKLG